ncbi:hypothetical protein BDZ97DRAFT_1816235 [Flammula alnicola]|nr:hypothetical protein BDZ97DRAFT_1816235 [Flammula alnicola]
MATVTHYIHSQYDPEDREKLEQETGQLAEDGLDPEEAWQLEASRIARRRAPPPHFVSATIPYGEWSPGQASSSKLNESSTSSLGNTLSGWYHSLTSSHPDASTSKTIPIATAHQSSSLPPEPVSAPKPRKVESRNKNNWFIMKAIQSEPSSSVSTPAPSLADILARNPPPLPSEGKYAPPVFLEIGPSNKGFGMLQRSGWNEGEPLGPDVIRRKPVEDILQDGDMISSESTKLKGKGKSRQSTVKETVEVKVEDFDDVSELRSVDMIDLTLSDSDLDESEELEPGIEDGKVDREQGATQQGIDGAPTAEDHMTPLEASPYARKALLTPIATVLKSDRLGIGLKAKTVGPYKASQKRVTHSAAALAAHVKAAEESRKRKQQFGRGHRGFEKQRRREEENRKALLAQLKSPW